MKKSLFILLLLPLFAFPQAEKPYRSIIIDSVKALNGGRIDVKDTLLLDSLAVYNSDLSSQYTSRSLVDSAFVGIAVSSGGANTIYSADDNLAGNRVVTMGANSLTFSGNQTKFKGLNSSGASFSILATDNTNVTTFSIENNAVATFGSGANRIVINPVIGNQINIFTSGLLRTDIRGGSLTLSNTTPTVVHNLNVSTHSYVQNNAVNFGVGLIAPTAKLNVRGTDATSINFAFLAEDNVGTDLFSVRNDGNVGIGTSSPAASAILDITSTIGAVLFPRMTTAQRDALTAVDGMVIFNTSLSKLQVRAAVTWVSLH